MGSVFKSSVRRRPTANNPVSNLVRVKTLGILGFGVILLNSLSPFDTGNNPVTDTIALFLGHETSDDCSGTASIQNIVGVTESADFYNLSGAYVIGDPQSPICELSETGAIQWQQMIICQRSI